MAIKTPEGKHLLLQRPNPLVVQSNAVWDKETLNFGNWQNFAPEFIQEQPYVLPPVLPQIQEDDPDDLIPEFHPVNTSDDDLYSGDFNRVAQSVGINVNSGGEGRTPQEGFDPYDPKFDNLHFNMKKRK